MKDWNRIGGNSDISALFPDPVEEQQSYQEEYQEDVIEEQEECEEIEENSSFENPDDEKLTQYRSAKYSDVDIERLRKIIKAVGLKNESEALRWILKTLWDIHGEEIERVAKEVERAEKRLRKIRTL